MTNPFNALVLMAVLLLADTTFALADMRPTGSRRLSVLVINHAQVPDDVLTIARQTAARIFHAAGIDIDWAEPGAPGFSLSNVRIVLKVIVEPPDSIGRRKNVMGLAVLAPSGPARYAYAFYRRVQQQAAATDTDPALVLGHVIAHEAGHLLLGNSGHSLAGIMRSNWELVEARRTSDGSLSFTNDQAAAIRRVTPPR